MMYCPKCLNAALKLSDKGVVEVIINGKQRDTGRFLYNKERETQDDIINHLEKRVEEFFSWYANMQNKDPIEKIELSSSAFKCENGCPISVSQKYNVADLLVPRKKVIELLNKYGTKYNIKIDLKDQS